MHAPFLHCYKQMGKRAIFEIIRLRSIGDGQSLIVQSRFVSLIREWWWKSVSVSVDSLPVCRSWLKGPWRKRHRQFYNLSLSMKRCWTNIKMGRFHINLFALIDDSFHIICTYKFMIISNFKYLNYVYIVDYDLRLYKLSQTGSFWDYFQIRGRNSNVSIHSSILWNCWWIWHLCWYTLEKKLW